VLEGLGYRVEGVPDLRIELRENLFQTVNLDLCYANVLPGLWRGEPAVHFLPYGLAALDAEAERRYRAAGVRPVRVSSTPLVANSLMLCRGGLRCFAGQL
jgi:type II restriction/modification system DNA methylase subunit YeeA